MQDADVGFGYGGKGFFLNHLGLNESFDILLLNNTKGERYYRLAVSLPDFERRQGKVYPLTVDLIIEYSGSRTTFLVSVTCPASAIGNTPRGGRLTSG
jgi:hypothetical protein